MKTRDFKPLIMWICLVAGILIIGWIRTGREPSLWNGSPADGDVAFILLYVLWLLVELRVSRRDVDLEGKRPSDSSTCQLYGLGQALTFFSALWFPSFWREPNVAHGIGIALFLVGVGYRLWAIRTLGRFYSHRVQTVAGQRIVTSGPYRFSRHPAYAGMIVANAGISLFFPNTVTLCVFLFLLVPAILWRIRIEEKILFGIEGYAEFAGKRKRLFPAIW
ncbi:MAG: DUF1295 domain-containing protein [Deltaproteobacteria bacterium]|nr:DUF1295 domain-containing protein [Deltaproteobacteria bacterium]